MIHRDLCDPKNTRNYSPLRMQFHLLISRYVCADGFIPLTFKEIAELLSCDIQSVYKFIKHATQEDIIEIVGKNLYMKKHVSEQNYLQIGYVAHLPFLESTAYKALSIQTQRFVLYALWSGVHTGRVINREVSALYHTNGERNGALNLYSKEEAKKVLEEAAQFFNIERFKKAGKDWFQVTSLRSEFKTDVLENQGEAKWLEDRIFKYYCNTILSTETKINIMQVKKEYFRKLGSLGLELVERALETLFFSFSLFQQEQRREVGMVLRGILNNLAKTILPTIEKRIANTHQAMKAFVSNQYATWKDHFQTQLADLNLTFKKLHKLLEKTEKSTESASSPFPFYNWLEN